MLSGGILREDDLPAIDSIPPDPLPANLCNPCASGPPSRGPCAHRSAGFPPTSEEWNPSMRWNRLHSWVRRALFPRARARPLHRETEKPHLDLLEDRTLPSVTPVQTYLVPLPETN